MFKHGTTLLFPILLLAFLAALTYWMSIKVQPAAPRPDAKLRHDPDYYLTNFKTTTTDMDGSIRYRLHAKTMNHFPDDDSTALELPIYTQYEKGKQYVQVKGKIGQVSSNGEDIKIYKDVVVRREPWGGKGLMTLETEYLNILPEEDKVLTYMPVVIKQAPKTVVHANGMVYEKSKHRITLLEKVRAHYEKPVLKPKKEINTLADKKNNQIETEIKTLRAESKEPRNLPNKQMEP